MCITSQYFLWKMLNDYSKIFYLKCVRSIYWMCHAHIIDTHLLLFEFIIIVIGEFFCWAFTLCLELGKNVMWKILLNSHNNSMKLALLFHIFSEKEMTSREIKWAMQGQRPASGVQDWVTFYSWGEVSFSHEDQEAWATFSPIYSATCWVSAFLLVLGICEVCVLNPSAFPHHAFSPLSESASTLLWWKTQYIWLPPGKTGTVD